MTENIIKIPFSEDQFDALVDAALYGFGYGEQFGTKEHIKERLLEKGIKNDFTYSLDDKNCEYVVTLK